jgi:hypothetical protein
MFHLEIHPQKPGIELTCNDYNDSSQPVLYQEIVILSVTPKSGYSRYLKSPGAVSLNRRKLSRCNAYMDPSIR